MINQMFESECSFQDYIEKNINQIDVNLKLIPSYCSNDIVATNIDGTEVIIEVKLRADRKAFAQIISYMHRSEHKYNKEPFGIIVALSNSYDLEDVIKFYNNRTVSHKIRLYRFNGANKMFEQII